MPPDEWKECPILDLTNNRLGSIEAVQTEILNELRKAYTEARSEREDIKEKTAAEVQLLHTRINKTREQNTAAIAELKDVINEKRERDATAMDELRAAIAKAVSAPWRWAVVVLGAAGLGLIVQMIIKTIAGSP